MAELTVLDIFCGAGGFSEGFRQQGFTIKLGIDKWQPAIDTFNHNFGVESVSEDILAFNHSIKKIESLPDTAVILGSPPCVTFSNSNASGKADKKSGKLHTKLFLKIVAVKKFKKGSKLRAWFMENVENSMKHLPSSYTFKELGLGNWAEQNGQDPTAIAITLANHQSVVNAADYGAPQKRKRLISGEIIKIEGSNHKVGTFPILSKTHQEVVKGSDCILPPHRTLSDILSGLPSSSEPFSTRLIHDPQYPGVHIPANQLSDHFYDTGLYECEWNECRHLKTNHAFMGKMSFPENVEKPSRTVMATRFGISRESMIFTSDFGRVGNGQYRTPTVREAACLMGFPVTYQFKGGESTKWRLAGNAVSPFVSSALARQLRDEIGLAPITKSEVQTEVMLDGIDNLNTYSKKSFDDPPKKRPGSRFRRHPFKDGNITVTLSNYDIALSSGNLGRWITSVQYGCGDGFPHHDCEDNTYISLESVISRHEHGPEFLSYINNGFLERIGSTSQLQTLHEHRTVTGEFLSPGQLIDEVARIINGLNIDKELFEQDKQIFFKNKKKIPVTQLFALYAISRISAKANTHE